MLPLTFVISAAACRRSSQTIARDNLILTEGEVAAIVIVVCYVHRLLRRPQSSLSADLGGFWDRLSHLAVADNHISTVPLSLGMREPRCHMLEA